MDFFLQHWQVVGSFTGRDLGPLLFQFTFETEQDLQAILAKAPYHFKRWMIILQRWEPIVSDQFPAFIPFWITVHGIPLHYWTREALEAIGEGLGLVEDFDVVRGRIRVHINGLKPLEKYLEISLAGETKQVELEYEKLDKHCLSCLSLSHEVKDCPSRTTSRNTADQNLGISQRRTLERIEENRRRTDNRKLSRFSPYDDPRTHRGSAPTHVNQSQYGHERNETRNHHYTERKEHSSDRSYSNRPYSVADNREKDSTRSREPRDRLPPVRESSEVSLRSRGMWVANPAAKNVWRPVSEGHGNGDHSNSIQSQVSHTPSPHPPRERITTPINTPQETSRPSGGHSGTPPSRRPPMECLSNADIISPTGERRSALARISTPAPRVPLLQNGVANSESGRLQEVNIQYLEEMFPYQTPEAESIPSSSRAPPLRRSLLMRELWKGLQSEL